MTAATSPEDCRFFAEECRKWWNRIDVLHNNVGIGGADDGPVHLA